MKIWKKLLTFALATVMLCTSAIPAASATAKPAGIYIEGLNVEWDVGGKLIKATSVNGVDMLTVTEMATLCIILGYDVTLSTAKTTIKDDAKVVRFYEKDAERVKENVVLMLLEDSVDVWMDGDTQYSVLTNNTMKIVSGTLMLPLEFCMNALNHPVSYDKNKNLIHIEMTPIGVRILLDSNRMTDAKGRVVKATFANDTVMLTLNQMSEVFATRNYVLSVKEFDDGSTRVGIYKKGDAINEKNLKAGLFLDSKNVWLNGKMEANACPTPPTMIGKNIGLPIYYCMGLIGVPVKYIEGDNLVHIGKTWGEELGEAIHAALGAITELNKEIDAFKKEYDAIVALNKEYKKIEDKKQAEKNRQEMIKRVRAYDRYDWLNTEKRWKIATDVMNYFIDQKYVAKGKITVDDVSFAISEGLGYYYTDSVMLAAKNWLGY